MTILQRIFKPSTIIFVFSLVFFMVIFYLNRHFMTSLDELDNILAPYLMSQGKKFFTDTFNMHFPLPFYIAYFFSPFWVSQEPSRAIAVFRLSLSFVYALSFILVFISYKKDKTKIAYSLWIILLTILIPLYHGNLYLSDTFSTIFISAIFWLILPVILKYENFSKYHLGLLIIFCSAAFWTQPLLIILFVLPFFFIKKTQLRFFLITSFFINLLPIIYFWINNQLLDFINQSILFNFQTYSNFFPEQINGYSMGQQNLLSFLPNEIFIFTHLNNSTSIYQLITHVGLIILLVFVIRQKNYKYILAFITIILATRLREIKIIPGQIYNFAIFPLLSISFASLILLIFKSKNLKIKSIFIIVTIIAVATAIIDFRPIFLQSLNPGYNYEVFWSYRQRIGEKIASLTKSDEKILIYPHDSDLYFFAKRQPIDRFPYWYPWINSVNQFKQERQNSLTNNSPVLIYTGSMGFKDDPQAYKKFFPELLNNYFNIPQDNQPSNYWIRSDLKSRL